MKWTPARSRWLSATSEIMGASPGTKLMTPGGSPASCRRRRVYQADSIAEEAGFQRTVFPMRAGALGRLPPMAVKLKGVIA